MQTYSCSDFRSSDMQILIHHIYEYNKGIRNMVLHTMNAQEKDKAESVLSKKGIPFYTQTVSKRKINIFFGNKTCVDVVKSFGDKSLKEHSPEEDFILGIMLGYDRDKQCKRYLKRKDKAPKNINIYSLNN